jgi:hypothetical protein
VAVVQYTVTHNQYTERHKHFGRVRAVPRLGNLYPGICLTTGEKTRKNLSPVRADKKRDKLWSEHSSGVLCVPSATHVTGYLLIRCAVLLVMIACYRRVLATAVDYICVQIMKLLRASVISVILVACNVDSCHQEVVKLCLWS